MNSKKIKILLALVLLFAVVFTVTACDISGISGAFDDATNNSTGEDGNQSSTANGEDYLTRDEVLSLIAGIESDITVNQHDIDITSNYSKNLLAASKGLLSAVSIRATFEIKTQVNVSQDFWRPQYETRVVEETSSGAGVIYKLNKTDGSGYIITNYHVVYNANQNTSDNKISNKINCYIYGKESDQYKIPATYVGGSMYYDIAVLKVEPNLVLRDSDAIAATFADSNDISVLQTAIAIGNPAAGGLSATVGCVNVDREQIAMTAVDEKTQLNMNVIRVDTAINGGNSGGGLFDEDGNVIGIVNAKIVSSEIDNIGYAIPSNVAKAVADNIIHYSDGTVKRVLIGITVEPDDIWAEYDETTGKVHKYDKVKISEVTAGSVASAAGLQVGDIIKAITVDGVKSDIIRWEMITEIMLSAKTDSTVVVTIQRGDAAATDITIDVSGVELVIY